MAHGLYDVTPLEPLIEQGYTLLTPNYRLARRIKAEWDARQVAAGKMVWDPAPVAPLEGWLQTQWEEAIRRDMLVPLVPLGNTQTLELWRQLIITAQNQSGDIHLLRPSAAADLAFQARNNLLLWQVDMSEPGIRQSFQLDEDCAAFLRWLAVFEEHLARGGLTTAVDCIAQLTSLVAPHQASRVALLECTDMPPLYRCALNALCQDVQELSPTGSPGRRLVQGFTEKRAELQGVAAWAANHHRENPAATIGIVLSDMEGDRAPLEYLLRREFDCLGQNYTSLPVNFSTGLPLAQVPLVRDALGVLALGLQQTTVPAMIKLMQSRFLSLPDADSTLSLRFTQRLYKGGRETLDVADVRHWACTIKLGEDSGIALGQHMMAMSLLPDLKRKVPPSKWVSSFAEILSLWGWPGPGALDSLEYQQLELWYRTLDEFRGYDAICNTLAYSEALGLLRDCCNRQVSQPQTADSVVQVLGPLEAAGLVFDHLWITGMQASVWPAPARPNPLIPAALQRALNMPRATAEREWGISSARLGQYARSATVLHASFCQQIDGVADLPSPLLQEFEPAPSIQVPGVSTLWRESLRQSRSEYLQDDCGPQIDTQKAHAASGGSALLEDQSHCPFRAYARRRLFAEPLPEFSLALSAAERGSLLHDALFVLWGEIGDYATLMKLPDSVQAQAIERAVEAGIEELPGHRRRSLGNAYWQLERQRLAALLNEWLALERQRVEFVVLHREQDIELQLGQLQIKLRVDRIDELPDGARVVIDYKSGISRVQDWLGARPPRPQLLLYGLAEEGEIAALAFAQVRAGECALVGLGQTTVGPGIRTDLTAATKAGMSADDWPALNTQWRSNLERLAAEFVAGEAKVDPLSPTSCTWCGLQPLCRIGSNVDKQQVETS